MAKLAQENGVEENVDLSSKIASPPMNGNQGSPLPRRDGKNDNLSPEKELAADASPPMNGNQGSPLPRRDGKN
ncbi:hypothetical protein IJI99_01970, partial [bacterium]|nr:hypothetical protein [bacterium]